MSRNEYTNQAEFDPNELLIEAQRLVINYQIMVGVIQNEKEYVEKGYAEQFREFVDGRIIQDEIHAKLIVILRGLGDVQESVNRLLKELI